MSSIVTDQGHLHFETIGRGKPVVLLHGWVNSWDVWREAMLNLAGGQSRRVYALDFWGFGDSTNLPRDTAGPYQISHYVEMVSFFMNNLGIDKAPIVGHSMGGTVAMQFALKYPERVDKIIVVGSPIDGNTLNPFLKLAGYGSVARLVWGLPIIRAFVVHMLLARDTKRVKKMIFRDLERASMESFFRSIGDLRKTDLRPFLNRLESPTLGIYGRNDNIVSPKNAGILAKNVKNAKVSMMDKSRHFPMSDEPDKFVRTITTFLQKNGS